MRRNTVPLALGALSFHLLWAFSTGPGPFRTGASGDGGHCAAGSCHVGAATRGEGVHLSFPNGPYYRPGVPQRLTLLVTGASAEPQRAVFGFQLSPRLGESSGGQLRPLDARAWVQCGDANEKQQAGCGPGLAQIEFAQHRLPSAEPAWEIEWTPPPRTTGPIDFYAAANAANGSGDNFGDLIYLRSFRVLPAGLLTIRQPFGGGTASPNAWLEIYGSNLAPENGAAVTTVRVGDHAAHVSFAGPSQVNVLLALATPLGEQTLELRSPTAQIDSPILIAETSPSLFPQLPAVRANEIAVLYATGCGVLASSAAAEIHIGRVALPATAYASPGFPGLCQFHFTPLSPTAAPQPLRVCLKGNCSDEPLMLQVR